MPGMQKNPVPSKTAENSKSGDSKEFLKICVHGACGRMGRAITRIIAETPLCALVSAIERPDHPFQKRDIGLLSGLEPNGVCVCSDLESGIRQADVVVDFSLPEAISPMLEKAAANNRPLVTGTTGIEPKALDLMKEISMKIPVVAAPNMSVAMNVMFALTSQAGRILGDSYDVEIIEWHHRFKEDAPSGTAIRLGEEAARSRGHDLQTVGRFARHGRIGRRDPDEIGIMSVRAGDIVGEHTVLFAGPEERLELSHRVSSRDNFARGALKAALWVANKSPGLYDMQDVLGLK